MIDFAAMSPSDLYEIIAAAREQLAVIRPRRTMADIVLQVAAEHDVSVPMIMGQTRVRAVAWARQEAFWHAHKDGRAYTEIGRFFGRDHATVMHGVRQYERRCILETGEQLIAEVASHG